ncbi:4-hydroxythreonine-4-phosphate dehydrogenase PdxA [Neorhodopirellula pilleata]|uniref:4-hydroxythreonine-4-phosphate dehydrogenase PdxA n=1 Tax=Neorhodopirellula pilleata TaxID=2714738 RepID=UPI0028F45087|nr:4-hydroxythreonine-4-phosphate dehydrogenase PdxA [Neorhodopirellula pilleata]
MSSPSILAVTMGDPAGVGPEVCLKAARLCRGTEGLVLFGDADVFSQLARQAELPLPEVANSLGDAVAIARDVGVAVYHIESLGGRWEPGRVSALTGEASYRYITAAIDAALAGQVDGVVTGPIHKEALRLSGVPYPGHTEIFEALTKSSRACMMLTSDALTCSFVTTHVGLCEVPGLISTERVLDVIELTDEAVRNIHGRASRLVVCGLNPHAGEGGLFGDREEERLIIPAIESARARGMKIDGPLPPDTAFLPARRERTDAFICMYHDQGHIPLKALSFETAVNTTLGLPIVRTSVDHGTALDIAWKDFNADPTSMLQAIALASKFVPRGGDFQSPIANNPLIKLAPESRHHGEELHS